MRRHDWRALHLQDAAAELPDRRATIEKGVEDLLTLRRISKAFGLELDRSLAEERPTLYGSGAALMAALDPTRQLGTVARKRIDGAHDVQLAGAIMACEPVVFGRLGLPFGGMVSTWTTTTHLPVTTPGVAVLDDGTRTRTHIFYALVGGEHEHAYSLPVLIEPARNSEDVVQLALQALNVAERGRAIVRRYVDEVGHTRLGSLPILAGTVRAAQYQHRTGSILAPPVAFGDLPELVDALDELRSRDVPVLVRCCLNDAGHLEAPAGWRLEGVELADALSERPGAPAGIGYRIRTNIPEALLGRSHIGEQLLNRLPDAPGVTRVTRGALVAQGTCGIARFIGVSHVSPNGRPALALTNFDLRRADGNARLTLAVEGLLGAEVHRSACRRRAARFNSRVEVPTNSAGAARRITGIVVLAYAPTVVMRVGIIQH